MCEPNTKHASFAIRDVCLAAWACCGFVLVLTHEWAKIESFQCPVPTCGWVDPNPEVVARVQRAEMLDLAECCLRVASIPYILLGLALFLHRRFVTIGLAVEIIVQSWFAQVAWWLKAL